MRTWDRRADGEPHFTTPFQKITRPMGTGAGRRQHQSTIGDRAQSSGSSILPSAQFSRTDISVRHRTPVFCNISSDLIFVPTIFGVLCRLIIRHPFGHSPLGRWRTLFVIRASRKLQSTADSGLGGGGCFDVHEDLFVFTR